MKKFVITILMLSGSLASQAQSPTWEEWFRQKRTQRKYLIQQIAALKVYLEYLKKGYEIAEKGLNTIAEIKNGTFSIDKDYFNSLKEVNPVVKNSPNVKDILDYNQTIMNDFRAFLNACRSDKHLSVEEIAYIENVYENMLAECESSMDELLVVITSGEAEMKDDERLLRLDKVHDDMQDKYAFTQDFINGTQLLSLERAREKNHVETSNKIFNEQ